FCNGPADVNTIMETSRPKRAESNVPAVVGETNLFWLSCCIICPQMLMLIPAIHMLTRRGILLVNNICTWSSVSLNRSNGETSETHMKIDATAKKIKAKIKYRFFIKFYSLITLDNHFYINTHIFNNLQY